MKRASDMRRVFRDVVPCGNIPRNVRKRTEKSCFEADDDSKNVAFC